MIICDKFQKQEIETFTYTFEVDSVKTIHLQLLEGEFEHFFVIVKNPKDEIAGLFSFKTRMKEYCISNDVKSSSNCTIPQKGMHGLWKLEVVKTYAIDGHFKINIEFDLGVHQKDGIEVLKQDINKVYNSENRWYQGDFHLHSAFTDGRVSLETIVSSSKDKNLDFIALSDHSIVTTKMPMTVMPIIPSTEITWDNDGHYNVHGIQKFIDYYAYIEESNSKDEALSNMFRDLKNENCIISLNHPFPYGWELKHDFDFDNIDLLEICNAPHLLNKEVDNLKAIRFFDFLWNHGFYVYGIGGSDSHKKNYFDTYPVGLPTTKVLCDGLSIQNVLTACKQGHMIVCNDINVDVEFKKEDTFVYPGDRVEGTVKLKARATRKVLWQLIHNGKVIEEKQGKLFENKVIVNKDDYYRIQVIEDGEVVIFINPIHNMKTISKITRFQEILERFKKVELDEKD